MAAQRQNEAVFKARKEEQELARKEAERTAQITEERRLEAALQGKIEAESRRKGNCTYESSHKNRRG